MRVQIAWNTHPNDGLGGEEGIKTRLVFSGAGIGDFDAYVFALPPDYHSRLEDGLRSVVNQEFNESRLSDLRAIAD
jgi:hypothetical protein